MSGAEEVLIKEDKNAAETKPLVEESQRTGSVEKEMHTYLKIIEAKPTSNGSGTGESKSGFLLKKKRKSQSWKKYWFSLDPSNGRLSYFKTKDSTRPIGVVPLSFLSYKQIQQEDELAISQNSSNSEVCKYRVSVFSPRRHYVLSAESDVEMQAWIEAINSVLQSKFSESELEQKRSAAAKLAPLIEEQVAMQLERYKYLNTVLAQSGFLSLDGPTKLKEGYLKLKLDDAEGSWRKYYFVLHKKYLNFYRLDDKAIPHGIIALKFMASIVPIEGKKNNRRFIIATPLRTYLLRAKHEVAMMEWINAIRSSKAKQEGNKTGASVELLEPQTTDDDAPAITGKLQLQYSSNGGKKKTYTLSSSLTTIGRASNNKLKLTDTKVSRNHAKIETASGKAPIFYDLGSSRGSKINNERVTKKALRLGDTIKIGNTILTVCSK